MDSSSHMIKTIESGFDEKGSGNSVMSISSETSNIPLPMDIVLGRGKGYGKNLGNMVFQGKIDQINSRARMMFTSYVILYVSSTNPHLSTHPHTHPYCTFIHPSRSHSDESTALF